MITPTTTASNLPTAHPPRATPADVRASLLAVPDYGMRSPKWPRP